MKGVDEEGTEGKMRNGPHSTTLRTITKAEMQAASEWQPNSEPVQSAEEGVDVTDADEQWIKSEMCKAREVT